MKVEVLHSSGCAKCLRELDGLRAAARQADPAVEWAELDILQALDYAVELGVLRPPALAIDGELVFPSLPTPDALAKAMRERRKASCHGRQQLAAGGPARGHAKQETMPTDACLFFYECERCKTLLRPLPGDCCVYCSFGSVKCPLVQAQRACCG